jgi:ABC-type transporter Mla MlaB component
VNNKLLKKKQSIRSEYSKKRRIKYLKSKENSKGKSTSENHLDKLISNSISKKLPSIFSLRDNTIETIVFINDLKKLIDTNMRIYLNMKSVEKINSGTIALLLSVVNEFTARGKKIIGSKPKNSEARKTLELSGFFDYMNGSVEYSTEVNSNTIIEQSNKCVEPQSTAKIVSEAMKTITGEKKRNKKLQGLFIELMANSINHGFPDNEKKKWILSTSHYKGEGYVSFSFIDNGVGILKTLNQKIGRQLLTVFKGKQDLLQTAFKGEIGSRTGLHFRGKGLPFIKDKFDSNRISNLFILTNNVILDYISNEFYEIDVPYSGTFYYFEINSKNEL